VFGLVAGLAAYGLLRSVDNYQVEILLSLALVAGGSALADHLHLSAPIAMVMAGLLVGNPGRSFAMSPTTVERLDDAIQVISLLKARHSLGGFELLPLDNLSESAVAASLGDSRVFLSFGYPEGFGLPPAEAMACGCLTVGFHGGGGREFITDDLAFPIEVGDILGYARTVEELLRRCRSDPVPLEAKAQSKRLNPADFRESWTKTVGTPLPTICHFGRWITAVEARVGPLSMYFSFHRGFYPDPIAFQVAGQVPVVRNLTGWPGSHVRTTEQRRLHPAPDRQGLEHHERHQSRHRNDDGDCAIRRQGLA
jgi:hypothetical protein